MTSSILILLGLQAAAMTSGPPVEFDGGTVCPDDGDRVEALFETHRDSLPQGTHLTVRLRSREDSGVAALEIQVIVPGEPEDVDHRAVNSCQEALAYLDFYLGAWEPQPEEPAVVTPPKPREAPMAEPTSARDTKLDAGASLAAFALASSNHSSGMGVGAGGQAAVRLNRARLGVFAEWNQPSMLAGTADQARFTLQRWDWGAMLCGEVKRAPFALLPCVGASARNFTVPSTETAPGADRTGQIASLDIGVGVSHPIVQHGGIEAMLLARYAPYPLDLGELQVGDFASRQFEVALRLGFTWDVVQTQTTSGSAPLVGAGGGRRAW